MTIVRGFVGLWLGLFLSLIFSAAAYAAAIEVKSDNFVLYGNIGEKSATSLVTELEDYRAAILQRMGAGSLGPEVIPVRIYIADGPKELEKMTGSLGSSGVYLTSLEGPVFVLDARSGFRRGNQARAIALHEYTHHLLASISRTTYPRWFNEGLAEYLSTFKTNKDGDIIIGKPDQDHASALKHIKWLPVERMLSSIRNYPYPNDNSRNTQLTKSIFYAQSWLAVHYIQSTPGYSQKLGTYLEMINRADTPENAFETAFEITPAEFGDALQAYYKRNRFLSVTIKLPETRVMSEINVREISRSELAYHLAEAVRHFRPNEIGFEAAGDYYKKAAADPALTEKIEVSKAQFLAELGRLDEAAALIEIALAANADDTDINRVAGMVWLMQNDKAQLPDQAIVTKARKALVRAMQLNPDNMPAHYYYAQSFVDGSNTPSRQAVASAQTSLDYYRSVNFVGGNVKMARVLIKAGRGDEAVPALQKAMAWSRSASFRRYAASELKRLRSSQ